MPVAEFLQSCVVQAGQGVERLMVSPKAALARSIRQGRSCARLLWGRFALPRGGADTHL